MKRYVFVCSIVFALTWFMTPVPSAISATPLADCIRLANPISSASSNDIILTADAYSTCAYPSADYQQPVYEMVGEDSLLNLQSCSGPMFHSASLGELYLGQIRCDLRISGPLASSRAGATSTQVKVWFAWDFSAKYITITHGAIPAASNGSSGTSGSSSSQTPAAPIKPSCTKAPQTPTVEVSWKSANAGPTFDAVASVLGDAPTEIYWNYDLYDGTSGNWDKWVSWTALVAPGLGTKFSYTAPLVPEKSRIAFAIYAANACGNSPQARERADDTGVPLAGKVDQTLVVSESNLAIDLGLNQKKIGFSSFVSTTASNSSGIQITAVSQTPLVCTISNQTFIDYVAMGTCRILFAAQGIDNISDATPISYSFEYKKESQLIWIGDYNPRFELAIGMVSVSGGATSNLPLFVTSETPGVCSGILATTTIDVKLLSVGTCRLGIDQPGDSNFASAPSHEVTFDIYSNLPKVMTHKPKVTLVCVRGNVSKRIIAFNPKCPVGYKKK